GGGARTMGLHPDPALRPRPVESGSHTSNDFVTAGGATLLFSICSGVDGPPWEFRISCHEVMYNNTPTAPANAVNTNAVRHAIGSTPVYLPSPVHTPARTR